MEDSNETLYYSPVVIPTLNRYEHLKRCIESLANCTGADKTLLVIGLDFPPEQKYYAGYEKIKSYLPSIKGFGAIKVLVAPGNLGTKENCRRLYEYVRNLGYNRYIFSEDDNEFSPNFLEYMNKGLSIFENDSRIVLISGYSYPDINDLKDTGNVLAFRKAAAWGCGRWFHKEFTYSAMGAEVYRDSILFSWKKSLKLFFLRPISLNSLVSMKVRNTTYGDSLMIDCMLLENKYCIFPSLSKVRNWGHDGTGEHSGLSSVYVKQKIDDCKFFDYDDIIFKNYIPYEYINEKEIVNFVNRYFIYPFVIITRYLFFRVTGRDLYPSVFKK